MGEPLVPPKIELKCFVDGYIKRKKMTLLLNSKWTLYYHDIFDKNWTLASYLPIMYDIQLAHQLIAINETIPENVVKGGMLFLFRKDNQNKGGGYYSFKVENVFVEKHKM